MICCFYYAFCIFYVFANNSYWNWHLVYLVLFSFFLSMTGTEHDDNILLVVVLLFTLRSSCSLLYWAWKLFVSSSPRVANIWNLRNSEDPVIPYSLLNLLNSSLVWVSLVSGPQTYCFIVGLLLHRLWYYFIMCLINNWWYEFL